MSNVPRRFAITLLEVVVVLIILLILAALLMPNVEQSVSSARVTQCRNNLKQIELALHQYHDEYGSFPPAVTFGPDGKAWHSWRVLLLPYLNWNPPGRHELPFADRYRLDEPWNSEANLAAVEAFPVPERYLCPSDDAGFRAKATSYCAVVGERTIWPPDRAATKQDLRDGAAVTIHVVECTGSGIQWTEPRDIELEGAAMSIMAPSAGQGANAGQSRAGVSHQHVVFADGTCRFIPGDTPPATVRSLLLRDDGGPAEAP